MNERIKELRKALGLTQQKFADGLGVKQNTIAQYESGRNAPIDAVISLICKTYGVSETWLRTGEGEMFLPVDDDDELAQVMAEIKLSSDELIRTIIKSYWRLDDKGKAAIRQLVSDLAEAVEKEKAPGE